VTSKNQETCRGTINVYLPLPHRLPSFSSLHSAVARFLSSEERERERPSRVQEDLWQLEALLSGRSGAGAFEILGYHGTYQIPFAHDSFPCLYYRVDLAADVVPGTGETKDMGTFEALIRMIPAVQPRMGSSLLSIQIWSQAPSCATADGSVTAVGSREKISAGRIRNF
jgi:hypothetical protein